MPTRPVTVTGLSIQFDLDIDLADTNNKEKIRGLVYDELVAINNMLDISGRDTDCPVVLLGSLNAGNDQIEVGQYDEAEDGTHGHCDTCGAPCNDAGCTTDATHEIANGA